MSAAAATAATLSRRTGSLPTWVVAALLAGGAVLLGILSGALGMAGLAGSVFAVVAVALVVALWRRPELSPVVILVAALTIEQFPFTTGQPGAMGPGVTPSDFTDRLPLFHGLGGVHVSPADLLVLTLLLIWLLKRGTSQTVAVTRSPLTYAIGALLVAVGVGVVVGQAHHGALRTAFTEVRPYFYLAVAYLVATVFATRLEILRLAMWALVLGSGFKAAQALYSFLHVRNQIPRPDFIVGHEEALFFALFIILTLSLWLFQIPGRLRTTATMLLPLVFMADLVNTRRAAWLILGGALIALTVVTMVAVPARRHFMVRTLAVVTVISAFYFPAYWNHTGALAGPARAVKSAVSPNTRDESSDVYRVKENENLKFNIREGGVLGRGFGLPIDRRVRYPGHQHDRPADPVHPAQRGLLHLHAHGAPRSNRVLVAARDRDHHRLPARAVAQPGGRAVRRAAGLRARRLRARGLQRPGLLHVPDRLRDRDAPRPRRGGAPAGCVLVASPLPRSLRRPCPPLPHAGSRSFPCGRLQSSAGLPGPSSQRRAVGGAIESPGSCPSSCCRSRSPSSSGSSSRAPGAARRCRRSAPRSRPT